MGKAPASSKADTAVKLVMIFFISLLSFSVGTYVGKQVSDSDYRRAALETDYNGGGTNVDAHAEEVSETADDAATKPISDEEVASLTDEFVKKEEREVASEGAAATAAVPAEAPSHAEKPATDEDGYTHHSKMKAEAHESVVKMKDEPKAVPVAAAVPTPAPAAKPTAKAVPAPAKSVEKAAERIANDLAPAADPKKTREPSSVLPTVATTAIGKYTVQVASYATEGEAKDQAAKLTGKGYSAFYIPATINNKTWYRVSVGLFSDQKSATNYRTELLATQAVGSAIVQKIVK